MCFCYNFFVPKFSLRSHERNVEVWIKKDVEWFCEFFPPRRSLANILYCAESFKNRCTGPFAIKQQKNQKSRIYSYNFSTPWRCDWKWWEYKKFRSSQITSLLRKRQKVWKSTFQFHVPLVFSCESLSQTSEGKENKTYVKNLEVSSGKRGGLKGSRVEQRRGDEYECCCSPQWSVGGGKRCRTSFINFRKI